MEPLKLKFTAQARMSEAEMDRLPLAGTMTPSDERLFGEKHEDSKNNASSRTTPPTITMKNSPRLIFMMVLNTLSTVGLVRPSVYAMKWY